MSRKHTSATPAHVARNRSGLTRQARRRQWWMWRRKILWPLDRPPPAINVDQPTEWRNIVRRWTIDRDGTMREEEPTP